MPYVHFYNAPVSSIRNTHHSPQRLIKHIATPDDFVAFKLDIDAATIEVPIALDLLKDDTLASLVDEFFFELHFRCEFMMVSDNDLHLSSFLMTFVTFL
jgi:hypothetical protein